MHWSFYNNRHALAKVYSQERVLFNAEKPLENGRVSCVADQ
jgi:hypothetical protein